MLVFKSQLFFDGKAIQSNPSIFWVVSNVTYSMANFINYILMIQWHKKCILINKNYIQIIYRKPLTQTLGHGHSLKISLSVGIMKVALFQVKTTLFKTMINEKKWKNWIYKRHIWNG